jgi:peptidoglycan/xylan/chitin deacetylase (PgdA/CDA1 family)
MASAKVRVYITIDTETSLGGAWRNPAYPPLPLDRTIFGIHGSRSYGIPLIMDILEERGFRGTFFTEVFCSYALGGEEVRRVFRLIRQRGHDAQLHLHPIYRFYRDRAAGGPAREIDLMHQLSPDEQRELIREGVTLFGDLNGQPPRAYRAGCYGASEVTLQALRENGVEIDSSYNMAYLGSTCGFRARSLNAPVVIEGVYEFPVTVFSVSGTSGYKPLEISAVSVGEILNTIRGLAIAGCRDVVLSLHSFSLLKNRGLRYDRYRPDQIVIQRLRRLCAALSEAGSEVEVRTLGEVDLGSVPVPQPQVVPSAGWARPAMRKLVQGVNRISWL